PDAHCQELATATVIDAAKANVRTDWGPYTGFVDTGALGPPGAGSSEQGDAGAPVDSISISIRLGISRLNTLSGGAVYWDDVVLAEVSDDPCGDCSVGEGEACDDGNHVDGDGCS